MPFIKPNTQKRGARLYWNGRDTLNDSQHGGALKLRFAM
jgi:hypothetical protein